MDTIKDTVMEDPPKKIPKEAPETKLDVLAAIFQNLSQSHHRMSMVYSLLAEQDFAILKEQMNKKKSKGTGIKRWTEEETNKLTEGLKKFNGDFAAIAEFIGTRTRKQVKGRYDTLVKQNKIEKLPSTTSSSSKTDVKPSEPQTKAPEAEVVAEDSEAERKRKKKERKERKRREKQEKKEKKHKKHKHSHHHHHEEKKESSDSD